MREPLGILLGVGLAFGLEYFDSSVRNPDIVWRVIAKPTLGTVPHTASLGPLHGGRRRLTRASSMQLPVPVPNWLRTWRAFDNGHNGLLLSQQPDSIIADSFRTIRTALFFSQAAKPPQMILVTSASPGEGKTVTSLNLAIAFAQGGKSVLVIDADLRKGRCHRAFGLPNHTGLTNVLTGSHGRGGQYLADCGSRTLTAAARTCSTLSTRSPGFRKNAGSIGDNCVSLMT